MIELRTASEYIQTGISMFILCITPDTWKSKDSLAGTDYTLLTPFPALLTRLRERTVCTLPSFVIIRREVRSLILTRRIASCLVIIVAQLVVQRWSNPKAVDFSLYLRGPISRRNIGKCGTAL